MSRAPRQDPLRPVYRESIIEAPKRARDLRSPDTALLSIDMPSLDDVEKQPDDKR